MKKTKKVKEEEPLKKEKVEMTTEKMISLLMDFYGSETWSAYQMYIDFCVRTAENILYNTDPVKEPTLLARKQGMREAFMMLENYIKTMIEAKKEASKEKKAEAVEGVEPDFIQGY